jgi:2-oxoglutarate dehydrogenase E2 component (dihydrolipoamide succinyltransferase)
MATIELKVPSPGESITEVTISKWLVNSGDVVEKDQELAEIESDKATLTINAEEAGKIEVLAKDGDVVKVGDVVCKIDTSVKPEPKVKKAETKEAPKKEAATPAKEKTPTPPVPDVKMSPVARNIAAENSVTPSALQGSGPHGRIMKNDVLQAMAKGFGSGSATVTRGERKEKMTPLRKKLSERLVSVKQQTAMLTTFNEVDMSAIMNLRAKYKDQFKEKYGVNIGFMSFFTKAVCEALLQFPAVNAYIDGENIVYHDYCDVGIAVSAPKGFL